MKICFDQYLNQNMKQQRLIKSCDCTSDAVREKIEEA